MPEATADPTAALPAAITAYKGFDKHLRCRDYQFAIGGTYEHEGYVAACASGFHACEYPLDVFAYYAPADSRFAIVEQSGDISRHSEDSKVASRRIAIKAELTIPALVKAAFEFVLSRCEPAKANDARGDSSASSATGDRSASSATGDRSASSATGDRSASNATGDRSASSATGDSSASSATGYRSASSATGDRSASNATGYRSASLSTGAYSSSEITPHTDGKALHAVAIAAGFQGKARAPDGSAIVLTHRADDGSIKHIRAALVGQHGVRADVWYELSADGEFVEVAE